MPWKVLYCVLLKKTLDSLRSVAVLGQDRVHHSQYHKALTSQLLLVVFPSGEVRWGEVRLWLREEEGWPEKLPILCLILLKILMKAIDPPKWSPGLFSWAWSLVTHLASYPSERPSCRAIRRNCGKAWAPGLVSLCLELAAVQVSNAGSEEVPTDGRCSLLPAPCSLLHCRVDPWLSKPSTALGRRTLLLFSDQRESCLTPSPLRGQSLGSSCSYFIF